MREIQLLFTNEVFSIWILIILAIITQHMVSWAGSILHEVGNEERAYAVFTFRDDRNMPMTTNILMNVCMPNVCMIFIFMSARKFRLYNIEKNLLCYIIAFFVYRLILICFILRRREMYSAIYEISMAVCAILLAVFIIRFFLSKEDTVFITAYELREELWIAIFVVLYQFFKQILDKKVLQNNVLTKGQISRYIIHKFQKFYGRYNHLLAITPRNRYSCIFLYSIMIFEDYNRGPAARIFERLKTCFGATATTGIMQIQAKDSLSDEESIILFYQWLENEESDEIPNDEETVRSLAWKYNNDDAYAQSVVYIFDCLLEYIDAVPKYRSAFCLREQYEKEDCDYLGETYSCTPIRCDDINTCCACINSNTFLSLEKGHYTMRDILHPNDNIVICIYESEKEFIISDVENLYIHGNDSTIWSESDYIAKIIFKNCKNINLEHLILGSYSDTEQCTGPVLEFENCENVTIKHLEIAGCKACGLQVFEGSIEIHNCKLHHCQKGGLSLNETHCIIDDVEICSCTDSDRNIIEINDSHVIINDTHIYESSSETWIIAAHESAVICQNVLIKDCQAVNGISNLANDAGITEQMEAIG